MTCTEHHLTSPWPARGPAMVKEGEPHAPLLGRIGRKAGRMELVTAAVHTKRAESASACLRKSQCFCGIFPIRPYFLLRRSKGGAILLQCGIGDILSAMLLPFLGVSSLNLAAPLGAAFF